MDDDNKPQSHILYQKTFGKAPVQNMPSEHLKEYLENQNIFIDNLFTKGDSMSNIDSAVNSINSDDTINNVNTVNEVNNSNSQVSVVESPNFNNVNSSNTQGNQTIFPTEIV